MTKTPNGSDVAAATQRAKDSTLFEHGVRVGLVAYSVVHLLVAWLALQLAFGDAKGSADQQGALRQLAETPLGGGLLWLLVVGFAMLVIWQLTEAAVGPPDDDGARAALKRAGNLLKAAIFGSLAFSSAQIAAGSSSGGSKEETWTAKLLALPVGQVIVGAVGLAVVGYGLFQIHRGWTEGFRKQLEAGASGGTTGPTIIRLGKIGYIAKGIAALIVGSLFATAAIQHDADESGGLDEALKTLLEQPFGSVLLTIVGLGIACFGAYTLARARYVRV